jgi:hypothetical protein
MHVIPHNGLTYFHNKSLNLVTTECLLNGGARLKFQSNYVRQQFDTVMSNGTVAQVNHKMEMFTRDGDNFNSSAYKVKSEVWSCALIPIWNEDGNRGWYWAYMHNFPCHHELPL